MNTLCRNTRIFNSMLTFSKIRTITTTAILRNEALNSLKRNPYFDKYSGKILEKQKISPDELLSRLQEHEQKKTNCTNDDIHEEIKILSPGKAKCNSTSEFKLNNLDKIMKLDLIKDKSSEEIKEIWEEFHKSKSCILCATVPTNAFKIIQEKSKKFPTFLLPLPRQQGYEFIMLQFLGNEVHFTPLISYQTHKENAPECLTVVYYPELSEEKNIVLMRGEYNDDVINIMEAQCLMNQLQLYYGENVEKRTKIMDRFTYYPDDFKHMDLIAEIECLSF